jgi:hypothetical protein
MTPAHGKCSVIINIVTKVAIQGSEMSCFLNKSLKAELQTQVLKIGTKAQFKDFLMCQH